MFDTESADSQFVGVTECLGVKNRPTAPSGDASGSKLKFV